MSNNATGRFRRLGRCFIDWATAVVGEGDACQLSVSFTAVYDTMAQSTEFDGNYWEKVYCPDSLNFEIENQYLLTNFLILNCLGLVRITFLPDLRLWFQGLALQLSILRPLVSNSANRSNFSTGLDTNSTLICFFFCNKRHWFAWRAN